MSKTSHLTCSERWKRRWPRVKKPKCSKCSSYMNRIKKRSKLNLISV